MEEAGEEEVPVRRDVVAALDAASPPQGTARHGRRVGGRGTEAASQTDDDVGFRFDDQTHTTERFLTLG